MKLFGNKQSLDLFVYRANGLSLNELQLRAIHDYYEAALSAKRFAEIYDYKINDINEKEVLLDVGYDIRSKMNKRITEEDIELSCIEEFVAEETGTNIECLDDLFVIDDSDYNGPFYELTDEERKQFDSFSNDDVLRELIKDVHTLSKEQTNFVTFDDLSASDRFPKLINILCERLGIDNIYVDEEQHSPEMERKL